MDNNKYLFISLIILIGIFIYYNVNDIRCISSSKDKSIRILVRQASRWSTAAQQDKSPLVSLLHANYGAGYLWALRDISTDNEIKKKTGIEILEFQKKIVEIQDKSTKAVTKACPQFVGDVDKYLLRIGGDA